MDSNLNIDEVNNLIELAQSSTEEAFEKERCSSFSPMVTRARSLLKNTLPDHFNKVKSTAITMMKNKKMTHKIEEDDTNNKVAISYIPFQASSIGAFVCKYVFLLWAQEISFTFICFWEHTFLVQ